MDQEEQKNADLAEAKATKIGKTWFIKRLGDGYVFACEENEASEIMYNRGNWMRRDFKIIGVSDGKRFQEVIAESGSKANAVLAEVQELEVGLQRYRQTEERMIYTDLIDPNDTSESTKEGRDRLQKLRDIINGYLEKIEAKNEEYKALTTGIRKLAFEEELKIALGHIERPRNKNIITPGATPTERRKIVGKMQGDE